MIFKNAGAARNPLQLNVFWFGTQALVSMVFWSLEVINGVLVLVVFLTAWLPFCPC